MVERSAVVRRPRVEGETSADERPHRATKNAPLIIVLLFPFLDTEDMYPSDLLSAPFLNLKQINRALAIGFYVMLPILPVCRAVDQKR